MVESLIFYFIYIFLAVLGLISCSGFSLVVVSRGYSLVAVKGFSLQWFLLLQSTGSRARGLQKLQLSGLVALGHGGSSRTRDRTHVLCTSRWILNHRTTREIPGLPVLKLYTSTNTVSRIPCYPLRFPSSSFVGTLFTHFVICPPLMDYCF